MSDRNICQSCGIDLVEGLHGTNVDNSLSNDYCLLCFQKGAFTEDLTLEQAANSISENVNIPGVNKEEAYLFTKKNLLKLKRWRI